MTLPSWTRRLRLLPLTIFALSLLLTVKLGALFTPGVPAKHAIAVTPSLAQQAPTPLKPGGEKPAAAPAAAPQATPPAAAPAATPSPSAAPAAPPAVAKPSGSIDPVTMSQSEIDILQALGERRRQLDERERAIEQREALMKAAEQRITEKVNELKAVQAKLEASLKQQETERDEQLKKLVKVYENMKPKDAARIFEQLEEGVLIDVAERMKEVKLAPVLASMEPKKATTLTQELSKRREIPKRAGG